MTQSEGLMARRAAAQRIFAAGVAAADPGAGVRHALTGPLTDLAPQVIVAVGKGARAMMAAALEVLEARGIAPRRALVVTNYENAEPLDGAELFAAGHPVPDENGARAAEAVEAALSGLAPGAQVLALISGGGSALLPAPVAGLSLTDKAEVNRLLLGSGADIVEMNLVRQQLSRLKGGGLLRVAAPAHVSALILSDVVGDDLRVIASGPTVAPVGTRAEAVAVLKRRGLWARVPAAVRAVLAREEAPAPLPGATNLLIGSNALSLAAMAGEAPGARRPDGPLTGDVAEAAERILAEATGPGVWLWGGETTVVLTGSGRGGRNQELALRLAVAAEAAGWSDFVFLSGGTDGRDGPTDAAGGLVDHGSVARIRSSGVDLERALSNNDSYRALSASDDLLMTGATGTNVADLQVLIRW